MSLNRAVSGNRGVSVALLLLLLLLLAGSCSGPGSGVDAAPSGTGAGADSWTGEPPPPGSSIDVAPPPRAGRPVQPPRPEGLPSWSEVLADAPGGVPSFVVVMLDDLGASDPGFAGHPLHRTPNMDRLAAEGVVFSDAYAAAPNCAPSRASLMTGLWTPRHGIYTVGSSARGRDEDRLLTPVFNTTSLDESLVTLPEVLRARGWDTGSVGKWHLGGDPRRHGFTQNVGGTAQGNPRRYFSPYGNDALEDGPEGEYLVDRMGAEAVAFLEEHARHPFFLSFSPFAVHTPLEAREEDIAAVLAREGPEGFDPTYAAMVESADRALGRVLDALDRLGRDDDTVVVFLSDNGGHGSYVRDPVLRGSKGMLYEGGLRVPLVVRWSGVIEPGRCDVPVSGIDIMPTVLDLAGSPPEALGMDGNSLSPLLFGTADPEPRRPLFWHFPAYLETSGGEEPWRTTPAGAMRLGALKLIEWFEDERFELYDLSQDPGERHDLASERPAVTRRLASMLAAWRQSVRAPMPVPKQGLASDWKGLPDRTWIGPDWFANRWADWRVSAGRAECVEGSDSLPMRTLHVLTRTIDPTRGPVSLRVRTGPMTSGSGLDEATWAGFLFGAGGEHVDPRITALVHHRPGEDGGVLAVVDGRGHARFRDNEGESSVNNGWSVGGRLAVGEVPVIDAPVISDIDPRGAAPEAYELLLTLEPVDDEVRAELKVLDADTGERLSDVRLDLSPQQVAGGIGLSSHGGGAGGWWFDGLRIDGEGLVSHPERAWGPVLSVLYTVSDGVLKLTAQLPPLGPRDMQDAGLQVERDGRWEMVDVSRFQAGSCTVPFRVEGWDEATDARFRVVYELRTGIGPQRTSYEGRIRPAPVGEMTVGSLNCQKIYTGGLAWNESGIWFPHAATVAALEHHDPDLLFFAGDQIYEGDLTPVVSAPTDEAVLDYLYKWSRFCWSFGDLTRTRPTICIPDDHDVFHGNLWGAGGRHAVRSGPFSAQDAGGYKQAAEFVNVVHATQTSHLPDPVDPAPIDQGIGVYHTALRWGGVSWAILADRMFKSAPGPLLPAGQVTNGWFENPAFDPVRESDADGAVLLGERQLAFLDAWATDWSHDTWIKGVLSQTLFANLATLPPGAWNGAVLPSVEVGGFGELPDDWVLAADTDSNGWPRAGRDRAVEALRRASAFHLAGDQHLPSTIQYGVTRWKEGAFAFCAPAIANTWPRRWFPPTAGGDRADGAPGYTGDHVDGFGNKLSVAAVANPFRTGLEPARLHDRVPGYGIVRLDRETRRVVFECWPRSVDPSAPGAGQYADWPVTFEQLDNCGAATAEWWLPRLRIEGLVDPVVQVSAADGTILRTVRIAGTTHRPHVDGPGSYRVRVGEPDRDLWVELEPLEATPVEAEVSERVVSIEG